MGLNGLLQGYLYLLILDLLEVNHVRYLRFWCSVCENQIDISVLSQYLILTSNANKTTTPHCSTVKQCKCPFKYVVVM
jgi:hypothetical protein